MDRLFQQLIDQQIRTNDLLEKQQQILLVQQRMQDAQKEQLERMAPGMGSVEDLLRRLEDYLAVSLEVLSVLHDKEAQKIIYRDAVYARQRIGISESTLLRQQRKGNISVAGIGADGKKFYTDEAVERLRTLYWGRGRDKV